MRLFKRQGSEFAEVPCATFSESHRERELEDWISACPMLIGDIFLVGRQVPTTYGPIDLLALDREGAVVVIELKRGQAPREIMAQMNDYLRAVEKWDEAELQRNANLIASSRFENTLLRNFQEHFKLVDLPPLNRRQWGVLMAEEIDDATVDRLGGSKYLIRALEFSYFRTDGDEYVVIQERSSTEAEPWARPGKTRRTSADDSTSSGEEWRKDPEWRKDVDYFFNALQRIEPQLAKVFPSSEGWRVRKEPRWGQIIFSRWRVAYKGIALGVWPDEEDSNNRKFWIGVHVAPWKDGRALLALVRKDEPKVRSIVGNGFEFDEGEWDPIYEWVSREDLTAMVERAKVYRDTFSPYLDEILLSRA